MTSSKWYSDSFVSGKDMLRSKAVQRHTAGLCICICILTYRLMDEPIFLLQHTFRKIWWGEEHLIQVERGGKGVSNVTTCKFFGMKIVLNMFLVVVRFGCCHTSETHDKCGCMCSRVFIGSHPYACSICTYLRSSRVELILENPSSHKIFGHKSFKSLKHGKYKPYHDICPALRH